MPSLIGCIEMYDACNQVNTKKIITHLETVMCKYIQVD